MRLRQVGQNNFVGFPLRQKYLAEVIQKVCGSPANSKSKTTNNFSANLHFSLWIPKTVKSRQLDDVGRQNMVSLGSLFLVVQLF